MLERMLKSVRSVAVIGTLVVGTVIGTMAATIAVPARADSPPHPSHKAFVLIEYQVRDKALFATLRETVRASLATYKGDLVMRDKVEPIFGTNPSNLSVISFPSVDDARAWLSSKEMAAIAPQRDKAAKVSTYLVEKLD